MPETKYWWQSRTIWLNLVAVAFAIGAGFKVLPAELDQEQVVTAIMAIVGILSVILRASATHAIGSAK